MTTWTLSSAHPAGDRYAYTTAYLPFAYTPESASVEPNLVTLTADGGKLHLEPCHGTVPEGTGVLLLNSDLEKLKFTLNIVPKADPLTQSNDLRGTYLRRNVSADDYAKTYVLSIHPTKKTIGFYYMKITAPEASGTATKAVLSPNKAYLPLSAAAGVRQFIPIFGDALTGVSTATLAPDAAPQIFDLQGRRISQEALQKGSVYIINGKKVKF